MVGQAWRRHFGEHSCHHQCRDGSMQQASCKSMSAERKFSFAPLHTKPWKHWTAGYFMSLHRKRNFLTLHLAVQWVFASFYELMQPELTNVERMLSCEGYLYGFVDRCNQQFIIYQKARCYAATFFFCWAAPPREYTSKHLLYLM